MTSATNKAPISKNSFFLSMTLYSRPNPNLLYIG